MPEQEKSQDWRTLCELASKEQDPNTLMVLVQKITQALAQKDFAAQRGIAQE
jgi:hypothetical protein